MFWPMMFQVQPNTAFVIFDHVGMRLITPVGSQTRRGADAPRPLRVTGSPIAWVAIIPALLERLYMAYKMLEQVFFYLEE